jgi:protein-tyrosine-phosphatase
MSSERAPVIEVDMKSAGGEHKEAPKPEIASRLEEEGAKMKEKRASLNKDDLASKLQQADANRKEILEEKVKTAKELEGHHTPKKA